MTTRTWDRILGGATIAAFAAVYVAYKTGSYQAVVDITIAGVFTLLAIGGIWISATGSRPLGEPETEQPEPDEPSPAGDDLMAIAACAYVDRDRIDIALDPTIPPETAFADDFEFLEQRHNWSVKR